MKIPNAVYFFFLVTAVVVATGKKDLVVNKNLNIRRHLDLRRAQSYYDNVKCGIANFSFYDGGSRTLDPIRMDNWPRLRKRILLDTIEGGRVNFVANLGPPCNGAPIKCVKLTLGTTIQNKQRFPPYALYKPYSNGTMSLKKPAKRGWNVLEAWTYTDKNCTAGEDGYLKADIHLVPRTIQTLKVGPLKTLYIGTNYSSKVTVADAMKVANVTCDYLEEGLGYGFLYKASIGVTYKNCTAKLITSSLVSGGYYQIRYTIVATFRMLRDLSPYNNPDLPTKATMSGFLTGVLLNQITIGPQAPLYLDWLRSYIGSENPFYNTTATSVL